MCGIAGIFGPEENLLERRELLKIMTDVFLYRGPDADGFYLDERLGLGFRRLAIIDPIGGNQPMSNEDASLVLVCNGEIYNHRALRRELETRGHRFKTRSDVEVILHLYEEEGIHFLSRLNGQFAFALYDRREALLFLVRDPVGIAPLFYTELPSGLLFASEIKALLQHPEVERRVDLEGLDQLLSFPGLVSPRTLFSNIRSLSPGHYLRVREGRIETHAYWDLLYPTGDESEAAFPIREDEALEELDVLLRQAVRDRLQAEVPVGFYLSGGLDSSLLAALIREESPTLRRHSFSIGFPEAALDERPYQRRMVERVNSIHHEILFETSEIESSLRAMVRHAETPLKESYNACSLALSRRASELGVKVVLSGEGADELFGGYVGYRLAEQRWRCGESDGLEEWLERETRERLWGDADFFFEKHDFAFRETKQALYACDLAERLEDFECTRISPLNLKHLRHRHRLHRRSYVNFKLRLADHLLADHGDRVAYAHSVEARYPFLDLELIEFVRTLPPAVLIRDLEEKYLLRRLARRYLPESIANREKFSFVAPGSPELLRRRTPWIEDLLAYERIARDGYFNPDTVEHLKTHYRQEHFSLNQTYEDDLLMFVLTFNLFLEEFGVAG
jgi:asparagine synthase (glutamine-hydrolysing)